MSYRATCIAADMSSSTFGAPNIVAAVLGGFS